MSCDDVITTLGGPCEKRRAERERTRVHLRPARYVYAGTRPGYQEIHALTLIACRAALKGIEQIPGYSER